MDISTTSGSSVKGNEVLFNPLSTADAELPGMKFSRLVFDDAKIDPEEVIREYFRVNADIISEIDWDLTKGRSLYMALVQQPPEDVSYGKAATKIFAEHDIPHKTSTADIEHDHSGYQKLEEMDPEDLDLG